MIFVSAEKNQNKHSTLNLSFNVLSKWHEPDSSVQKIRQNYLCARCWRPFLFGLTRASLCAMLLFEPFFFVVCLMFCRMLIVECWRKLSVRFRQATFFIRSKSQLFPHSINLGWESVFSERVKERNYFVYINNLFLTSKTKPRFHQFTNLKYSIKAREPFKTPFWCIILYLLLWKTF